MFSARAGPSTAVCFFFISVGYKLAWTTISSLLSDYSKDFGPEILLWLNFAYLIPSIPVLMLQAYWNEYVDRWFGTFRANIVRFTLGLGGLTVMCALFPYITSTTTSLLAATAVIGSMYGVAFGTSYQIVARFPAENSVALTTGFVSTGLVVLVFDLLLKSGPYYTPRGMFWLYQCTAAQTFVGLLASYWVAYKHWQLVGVGADRKSVEEPKHQAGTYSNGHGKSPRTTPEALDFTSRLTHRHRAGEEPLPGTSHPLSVNGNSSALQGADDADAAERGRSDQPLLERGAKSSTGGKAGVPLIAVFWRIWPAATALFLSVGTSMLIFPFFTYMHSTGLMGPRLPQILFYIRMIGDIAGRVFPKNMQMRDQRGLLWWALAKCAMVPLLFACIFRPEMTFGDLGATIGIAIFWVLSGYINTLAYLVAPTLVAPSQGSQAGGLMATAFQTSCFLFLVAAYIIQVYVIGDAVPRDAHMMSPLPGLGVGEDHAALHHAHAHRHAAVLQQVMEARHAARVVEAEYR